ncbi:hypothetical protein [Flammeovirga sp. SJP92]|uniref:hypothetical protein n=1 Tax=Flammeovirga sp. SJP92 TaxID=1775430 RepID=UPI000786CE46|nr:hypothetical protein [Flammeovirga sp. SJP92]KXX71173.1 hypothetical protein AVL50_10095 [Flammeovirga sp. SJP92]
MKRASNILLILFLIISRINTYGQITIAPLLTIKDNLLDINYNAKQEYCLFEAEPKNLIENPEYRAQLIKDYRIKSITYKTLSDEKTELFDSTGHLVKVRIMNNQEQIREVSYFNEINNQSFLVKSSPNRKPSKNLYYYNYDKNANLISYNEIDKRGFFRRRYRASQNYIYDTNGNLREIKGVKQFDYDSANRLVLEKEINIYGERFSKVNRIKRDRANYANRQFKEYFYNSSGLLKQIRINHFDSLQFKNYKITFEHDDLDRLIKITKYHASGEEWKVNKLEYSNGYIITNSKILCSGSDSFTIVKMLYHYENGLITKSEKYFSNKWTTEKQIEEVKYEYTFY